MSRETRRDRTEMGFHFKPGLRIAVGSMGLISGARNVQVHGAAAGGDNLDRGAVQIIVELTGFALFAKSSGVTC